MSNSAATDMGEDLALPGPGDVIAGKYRVDRLVGRGGMGVVLAAQHVALGQVVAIKLLVVEGFDELRRREASARFLREGQSAARLTSDHVVRIYDTGTLDSGAPFMVMELLRGEDLSTLLERQGPAPVEVAVEYVVQACDAVAEAHVNGIVHRDLKPSNLFVSRRSDGRPLVKVLDFGISKAIVPGADALDGNLTTTRSVVGSPYYMSPEQVRDAKRVDARTDIWSLGMILYELMTGEPAFNADTLPGICAAIAADEPAMIRERRPDVPPEVEAIVMRCLAKDPAKRFQNIPELVKALSPFIPHSPASSVLYASRSGAQSDAVDRPKVAKDAPTIGFVPDSGPRPSADAAFMATDPLDAAPNTMASEPGALPAPPTPGSGRSARSVAAKHEEVAATLVSPTSEAQPAPAPKARWPLVLVGVASVAVLGLVGFLLRPSASPPAAPLQVPARAPQFTMVIESMPTGAHVFDNDKIVGTTPFTTVLSNDALSASARKLTVRLDGYEPFDIVQGPSETNVRTLATLTRLAKPAPPATDEPKAAPAPAATGAAPKKSPAPKAAPHRAPAAPGTPPPPAPDIRLER